MWAASGRSPTRSTSCTPATPALVGTRSWPPGCTCRPSGLPMSSVGRWRRYLMRSALPPSRSWRCRSWPSCTPPAGCRAGSPPMRYTATTRPCVAGVRPSGSVTCSACPARSCSRWAAAPACAPSRQLTLVQAHGWNRLSAGAGSKGERDYEWAWIATASDAHHLLVRRSLSDPGEVAYFYCYSPPQRPPATLAVLVRVAGMRWPVEEDFRTGKDHFGLDHSQVRLYTSLLRHLTLTAAALAICSITAAAMRQLTSVLPPPPVDPDQPPPADPGLVPL